MSPRTRLQLHALAGVGLLGMSVTAWWNLGPTGSDLLLAHAPSEALQTLSALARQLLEFSLGWAGPLGLDASMAWNLLRLENLLWILLAGWICALLLARTVAPWLGAEAAHAVLRTGLLVLPVSGFSILQGAHVLARGEILALLCSLACALAYLRARQDSRRSGLVLAALLAVLAGAAGHASFALPFLVAVLEWLSARRHRGAGRQLAASVTALFVLATLRFGAARLSGESLVLEGSAGEALARGLAVLGRSLAPLDLRVDLPRALASGVLVLAALQPLLIAARSAPRTWGRFSLAWIVVMAAVLAGSLVVPPAQRPQPWYLELLVPGLLVSAGLCIAVSARGGWRRAGLPWALALVGLWIAQPLVRGPVEDRSALEALRARVAGDSARAPEARRVLTGWEQQPFALAGFSRERREALLREFCGGTAALDCLSSVDLQRWAGMELFPADVLWIPVAGPTRRLQRATSSERLFWRESARSPQVLDLDPRLHHAVRIVSRAGTPTERAPVLHFRAEGEDQPAAVTGLWIPGSEPAVAWFDMSGDPRWMLAERIRRIWSEGDLNQVTSAEILRQLPATRELPAVPGEQWFWVAWDGEARRSLEVGLAGAGERVPPTPSGGEAWLERRAGGILLGREKL